jgi:uncharacterized protein (TIGR02246 family)
MNGELERLVDEAAIGALLLRFADRLDAKDWEAYAATFADDGVFEIFGQQRVGREAIAAGPARDLTRFARTQHYSVNHVIAVSGDEADARASLLAVHIPDLSRPAEHADVGGVYHCTCLRTGEGWRFRHVRLEILWTAGTDFTAPDERSAEE